jgi:hypothetical protein
MADDFSCPDDKPDDKLDDKLDDKNRRSPEKESALRRVRPPKVAAGPAEIK